MVYSIHHEYGEDSTSWGFEWVDGDIDKTKLVDPSEDDGVVSWSLVYGRSVEPDFLPAQIRPTLNKKRFPDYFSLNGRWVSEAFRTVAEVFEPGVHQFFPVDVVDKRGELLDKRYLFVVCNRIDSVHREKTERLWMPKGSGRWMRRSTLKTSPEFITRHIVVPEDAELDNPEWYKRDKLVFDKSKIEGHHIWVDKYLQTDVTYVSNEIYGALIAADLHEFGGTRFDDA